MACLRDFCLLLANVRTSRKFIKVWRIYPCHRVEASERNATELLPVFTRVPWSGVTFFVLKAFLQQNHSSAEIFNFFVVVRSRNAIIITHIENHWRKCNANYFISLKTSNTFLIFVVDDKIFKYHFQCINTLYILIYMKCSPISSIKNKYN